MSAHVPAALPASRDPRARCARRRGPGDRRSPRSSATRPPVLLPPTRSPAGWCPASSTPTATVAAGRLRHRPIPPKPSAARAVPPRARHDHDPRQPGRGADLSCWRPAVDPGARWSAAASWPAVHLEGPFLSPAKRGAHDPTLLRSPDPEAVDRLLTAGEGTVAMVTVAPELPGGLAAIDQLVAAGVVAAVGHTTPIEVDRRPPPGGATVATHLFNAMPPIHHREPGPIPRLLDRRTGDGRADRRRPPSAPRRAPDGRRRSRDRPGRPGHRRHAGRRDGRRVVPTWGVWRWRCGAGQARLAERTRARLDRGLDPDHGRRLRASGRPRLPDSPTSPGWPPRTRPGGTGSTRSARWAPATGRSLRGRRRGRLQRVMQAGAWVGGLVRNT